MLSRVGKGGGKLEQGREASHLIVRSCAPRFLKTSSVAESRESRFAKEAAQVHAQRGVPDRGRCY
eukprot:6201210-Pleurochrysis_carterae.AAC.2